MNNENENENYCLSTQLYVMLDDFLEYNENAVIPRSFIELILKHMRTVCEDCQTCVLGYQCFFFQKMTQDEKIDKSLKFMKIMRVFK